MSAAPNAPASPKAVTLAGVHINGGPVPKAVSDHLKALIDVRVIDRA